MDIAIALVLSFGALLWSVHQGIAIVYPLMVALGLIAGGYQRRGVAGSQLRKYMQAGISQAAGVIVILLLIGLVVASWLLAGTVPTLVYYGLHILHPQWFLVSAFVLTGLVSTLLGTAFGSAGTIGLALMIMARGAGVDEHWAAGAVIAGAYVGDRCSPMSSGAHLVATITNTDIYRNLRWMLVTSWSTLGLSLVIYSLASLQHPVLRVNASLTDHIAESFWIHPVMLLPAGLLGVLTLLRVPVRWALAVSLGSAIVLAMGPQGHSPITVLQTLLFGLQLDSDSPIGEIFQGGGLWAMAQVCGVVIVSTALAGLLAGMNTFNTFGCWLARWSGRRGLFGGTVVAGALTSVFGCTQTIAILLTHQIVQPRYGTTQKGAEQLAVDIENSAVVLAPLVPWNIAGFGPAALLMTDAGFAPYAVYLYLLPLLNLLLGQAVSWPQPIQRAVTPVKAGSEKPDPGAGRDR